MQTITGFSKYLLDKGALEPKTKTVAFIVEDTDYGRTLADLTTTAFKAMSWNTVTVETVQIGQSDFYPQLTKIKRLQPDVLVTGFTSLPMGVALTKQYSEIGISALHFGTYYEELPGFLEQVGAAAEGEVWAPTYNPISETLAADVRKRWNITNVAFDYASGHDLMNVALQALSKAGSLKPDDVSRGFAAVDYDGIKGRYVFDPRTHVVKDGPDYLPMIAGQVQDGRRVSIWPEKRAAGSYKAPPSGK
jgi:branched-chain amino acid transport system substrate-binding protein